MASNGKELAEEMAEVGPLDWTPKAARSLAAVMEHPEGQRLALELERLHLELIEAPLDEDLAKIRDCQWQLFQLVKSLENTKH
jgi:hypothetical protein